MRLALALVLLLALPATASASKVSVVLADGCAGDVACSKYGGAPPVPVTTFEGAAGGGQPRRRAARGRRVRDPRRRRRADRRVAVRLVDAHSARCPVTEGTGGVRGFGAALGDGDDR